MDGCSKVAVFQTMKLTLSPCCPSDRADFMDLERDPEVMRFLNGGHAVDQERSDPDATFLMPRGTETYVWTARRTTNGAFVGWFCLWPEGEKGPSSDIACAGWIGARGWPRKGLLLWSTGGSEAGGMTGSASTMAVNHASRRVLEKIGLNYVRTVYVDWADAIPGSEDGEVQYELMRSEWNGS